MKSRNENGFSVITPRFFAQPGIGAMTVIVFSDKFYVKTALNSEEVKELCGVCIESLMNLCERRIESCKNEMNMLLSEIEKNKEMMKRGDVKENTKELLKIRISEDESNIKKLNDLLKRLNKEFHILKRAKKLVM